MKFKSVIVAFVLAGCTLFAASASGAEPLTGEVEVELRDGLFGGKTVGESPADLVLALAAHDGQWERVWGHAFRFNTTDHDGRVTEAAVTPDAMRLAVNMHVHGDLFTRDAGGPATYTIELKRQQDGALAGTYQGTWRGQRVNGLAVGTIKPPRPVRVKDYAPVQPGEHPRVLFRKGDLPKLKEKAATEFGKAAVAKLTASPGAVEQGLMYQLTGDPKYAEHARAAVTKTPPTDGNSAYSVALAYDLCYDAWPDDFKRGVEAKLATVIARCFWNLTSVSAKYANWHPCSNYSGPHRGGAAIATLALWGEKGPKPDRLPEPEFAPPGDGPTDDAPLDDAAKAELAELQKAWETSGGIDPRLTYLFEEGERQMYHAYRLGIGTGGFQAEIGSYSLIGVPAPLEYATLYRTMFGRDLSPYPDATAFAARMVMTTTFRGDGKGFSQPINGISAPQPTYFARNFPIVPDPLKPAVLWAWNRTLGITDEKSAAKALDDNVVRGFINYPLDLKPLPPAECMPLTWEAPTRGLYVFRNGWKGAQGDVVLQVFTKEQPIGGWNHPNAGTLNLQGLGHEWAVSPSDRNGYRWEESVVKMPDDEISEDNCAHRRFLRTATDGSGALSIDMNDVYGGTKLRKAVDKLGQPVMRPMDGYEQSTGRRIDENWLDAPIKGMRAVAVDYSGKSGAPAVIVLADKITGGGAKHWLWQLPAEAKGKVKVANNTFTVDYGDASLTATFIAPEHVHVEALQKTMTFLSKGGSRKGLPFSREMNAVQSTGGDNFLVVLTLQRGPAPTVKSEGNGLTAKITVGEQTFAFDGEKIVTSNRN